MCFSIMIITLIVLTYNNCLDFIIDRFTNCLCSHSYKIIESEVVSLDFSSLIRGKLRNLKHALKHVYFFLQCNDLIREVFCFGQILNLSFNPVYELAQEQAWKGIVSESIVQILEVLFLQQSQRYVSEIIKEQSSHVLYTELKV